MIRALQPTPLVIEFPEVSDEERAAAIAGNEEFKKNVEWWNAHVKEVRDAHTGKFVCVAGQELFVGDDSIEVLARATAAHPNPGSGFVSLFLSPHRGPKIHANQRQVV